MIAITALNIIREGRKQDFLTAVRPLIDASRAEEGNISYDLYEDLSDAGAVCFIEHWKDEAAVAAHNTSPHFLKWIARKESLVERSEVRKYTKLSI